MSEEAQQPSEFRRYRQILSSCYLFLAASVVLLLTASVVKELFFRRPASSPSRAALAAAPGELPDRAELIACHGLVLGLMTDLGRETATVLALPPQGGRGELVSHRWEDFSRAWRDEWDAAEARCRFSELAESQLGIAFDRLAKVHGDLPSMRLKYQSLIARFEADQADELAQMRNALDLSRSAFESMAAESASPPPAR